MDDAPQNACVLLVEDHRDIAEMVYDGLEASGFQVDYASDGAAVLGLAAENDYDVVVLDLMLPRLDGMEVCRRLRKEHRSDVPVLMLTARDTLEDKIAGLDAGPTTIWSSPSPSANSGPDPRAARRRRGQVAQERFEVGELVLDTGTWHVSRAGQVLSVTPIGMKLLTVLMRAAPQIVSRRQLEREVWGEGLPDSDTLRSHLYTLRKVVDRSFEHAMIETVSGALSHRHAEPDRGE